MARFINVSVENTYEYQGHNVEDFGELVNLLNFNLHTAQDVSNYKTDVKAIMEEAKSLARTFVRSNHPLPYSAHQPTNTLHDSIDYELTTSGGGTGARLFANAVDSRGHRYAGHIEYGFTDKLGIPHGPWPFLRPAMRIAAEASTGNLANHMAYLMGGGDYHFGTMQFGQRNIGSQIANYNASRGIGGRHGSNRTNFANNYKSQLGSHKNGAKWSSALNGIGYKSGVESGVRASETDFRWGEL